MLRRLSAQVFALIVAGSVPATAELVLSGRVIDEEDRPVAGAVIELRPVLDLHDEGLRLLAGKGRVKPVAQDRSDRRGAFELAAPEIGIWRITVGADGRVPMTRVLRPLLHEQALDDVRLLRGDAMTVTVTGDGSPVAGALVDARTPRDFGPWRQAWETGWWPDRRWAVTGDDGRVTLLQGSQEQPEIGARAAGFGPATAGAGRSLTIALEPGPERILWVVDAGGKAAAGVVFFDSWRPLGITAEDGSIRLAAAYLERVPLARLRRDASRLAVSISAGYQATLSAIASDQTVLLLPAPNEVGGYVADREGRPIAGALVWRTRGPAAAVRTDARGRFRWLTAENSLLLGFAADGYQRQQHKVDAGAEISSDLAVVLDPAAVLAGRVLDEDGLPVAGARVQIRSIGFRDRSWNRRTASYRATTTSADGVFRAGGLPAGELQQIRVHREGYAAAAAMAAAAALDAAPSGDAAPELEIVLWRGAEAVGQVVDTDDQAVAGARVRFSHQPAEGEARLEIPQGEYLSAPETMTGDDGRFAVRGLPAGDHSAEISRQGYATRALPGVRVAVGPEARQADATSPQVDLGTIILAAAAQIEARVTDPDGEPIPDVRVWLHSRGEPGALSRPASPRTVTLETDDRGIFRYDDLQAGERIDLRLDHPAHVEENVEAVEAPTPEPLEIVLRPGAAVSGIVVTEDGRGVARAFLQAGTELKVETRFQSSSREVSKWGRTDAGGRFELRGVHPGEVRLSATFEGFAEEVRRLELAEGERRDDLRIVLRRGATVSGRVLDSRGQAAIGVEVSLTHRAGEHENRGTGAITDGEGRFRIAGRPLGPAEVAARHREHGAASVEIELVPGDNPVELTLGPSRQVSGRVLDGAGRLVPGAKVTLLWHSGSHRVSTSRSVEADGFFSFVPERLGSYEISAEAAELAPTSLSLTVGEEPITGLELVLLKGAAISGVVLGISPEEYGRVSIMASRAPGEQAAWHHSGHNGTVDAQGHYRISGLDPGRWQLQANLLGSARQARATVEVLEAGSEVIHDLELTGGDLSLTGVVLVAGEPTAGVNVFASNAGGSHAWSTTSSQGRFRLEGLEPGTFTLRISGDWGTYEEAVELWSDRDLAVEIELRAIAGRIVSAGGEPLAEVALALFEDTGAPGHSTAANRVSGAGGSFAFSQIRAARYRLLATREGFATSTTIVDVTGADAVELEVILSRGPALVLELRTVSGQPPGSVQVVALDAAGRPVAFHNGQPDVAGRLEVTAIPAGSWLLTLVAADAAPARLGVEVPGGPYAVMLQPRTELKVTVPALADSPEAASLTVLDSAGQAFTPSLFGSPMEHWPLLQGEVVLPYLPPGTWELRVEAAGGATWSGVATTRAEQPTAVILR